MLIRAGLLAGILWVHSACAAAPAENQNFLGTWEAEGSPNAGEVWKLEQEGTQQSVVRTEAGKVTLSLKCKPVLRECHGTDGGKRANVTMYFSGPALVHWEVRDTNLILRRFVVDGQNLTIEARQITGQGKPTALRLVRHLRNGPTH
jgi:hypothetical protein